MTTLHWLQTIKIVDCEFPFLDEILKEVEMIGMSIPAGIQRCFNVHTTLFGRYGRQMYVVASWEFIEN